MEIFQTLWGILTTPNEQIVINILSIPFMFIEAYVTMLFFTTILNIGSTKKQRIFFVLLLTSLSLISNFIVVDNFFKRISTLILTLILIKYCFKISTIKSLTAFISPLPVFAFLETILIRIYTICFHISYEHISAIPIYRISIVSIMYLVFYILCKIIKYFNFNITLLDNMNKRFILVAIFGIFAIMAQIYLVNFYNDSLLFVITLLGTLCSLIFFFISMYSLLRTTKLEITTQSLQEATLYNQSLKILHDNVRGFRHDFSNIVQAIGGYVASKDMDGLSIYYSQLLQDCQKVNNLSALSPDVINNAAIYGILASKYLKSDELGIDINLDVFLDLNTLNMKIYEFTRILGILLDNAIEASLECNEKKIINVQIRKDPSINRQLLIVENSYANKDVDLDKIREKGFSSKPNNTGLGLWEVNQILIKNNNLNLYTTKNPQFFKQQLEIYL